MTSLAEQLRTIAGPAHVVTDPEVLASRSVDWTGRYRGAASALVRPSSPEDVAAVLAACRSAGVCVTVQGGRTSLVAGTVPEHGDVLLSTERLTDVGAVDRVERQVRVGAGVTLAQVQRVAASAGLLVGVDLTARDSATIGGMAATNAGGLRTVRYGCMREQVVGLEVALPDGPIMRRHPRVHSDNTGYDMAALFVGSEGTLGVITAVDLRLHPVPAHRVTAVAGFSDLDALVRVGRQLRDIDTISALELIDGRGAALGVDHLDVPRPVAGDWLLLVELTATTDPTETLAEALDDASLCGPPSVGIDSGDQQRLWRLRESMAEVVTLFGPPVKFDVSLPISAIASFTGEAVALIARLAPRVIPVLFGHIGEGNLHLNVLRCDTGDEARIFRPVMELIAAHGGNVSSEHGVGSRKRGYLPMSRDPADIAVMRRIKGALDPTGYLNPAVLFD